MGFLGKNLEKRGFLGIKQEQNKNQTKLPNSQTSLFTEPHPPIRFFQIFIFCSPIPLSKKNKSRIISFKGAS